MYTSIFAYIHSHNFTFTGPCTCTCICTCKCSSSCIRTFTCLYVYLLVNIALLRKLKDFRRSQKLIASSIAQGNKIFLNEVLMCFPTNSDSLSSNITSVFTLHVQFFLYSIPSDIEFCSNLSKLEIMP